MIFIIFLILIYFQFGVLVLIQIVLSTIVYLTSNFLIGFNPFSKELHVIRITSIFVIIFILYYNSIEIPITSAFIIPFSINSISYLDEIDSISVDNESNSEMLYLFNTDEISDFLNKLDIDDNYIATIEFIPEISDYNINAPRLFLSKPFLLNSLSSPATISKFIFERLNYMADYYYLDDSIIQQCKHGVGPMVLINYYKIYIN
jgi:hypothetical protein